MKDNQINSVQNLFNHQTYLIFRKMSQYISTFIILLNSKNKILKPSLNWVLIYTILISFLKFSPIPLKLLSKNSSAEIFVSLLTPTHDCPQQLTFPLVCCCWKCTPSSRFHFQMTDLNVSYHPSLLH